MSQTKTQLFDTAVNGPAALKTGTHNATLDASGNLNIGTGNLIVASGKGIDFSATSGSGTSELLDDYEEGTWTPFFCKTSSEENMFVNNNLAIYQADYRRIGDTVFASCYIQNDSSFSYDTGRGATEPISVGGLPFPVKGTNHFYPGTVGYFAGWTGWSAGFSPMCYALTAGSSIVLTYAVANGVTNIQAQYLLNASSSVMVGVAYTAA
jgi:hypothetical protein